MIDFIGYAGTALVVVAYVPQIAHLWRFRCSWGVSLWSWVLWLAASLLLLSYAVMKGDMVFIAVQLFGAVSITTTIVLYRKSAKTCPYHSLEKLKT